MKMEGNAKRERLLSEKNHLKSQQPFRNLRLLEMDPQISLMARIGKRMPGAIAEIRLRDDRIDRVHALYADELLIEAVVEVGEIVRIEAELVQNGGVDVIDV